MTKLQQMHNWQILVSKKIKENKWIWNQPVNLNRLASTKSKSRALRMLADWFLCYVNDARALIGHCFFVTSCWCKRKMRKNWNVLNRAVFHIPQQMRTLSVQLYTLNACRDKSVKKKPLLFKGPRAVLFKVIV